MKPRTYTTAEKMIDRVRNEIYASGQTFQKLADKAGVSVSTIHSLASGKTRWPRQTTLFPLLEAMGLHMLIERKGVR